MWEKIKSAFGFCSPKCPDGYNQEQWEAHLAWAEKASYAELKEAVDTADAIKYELLRKKATIEHRLKDVDPQSEAAVKAREILAEINKSLKFYA